MLEIGDIVILKVNCLGNKKGTYGIVYEEYSIGVDHKGVSVFFPNRNPDGFSTEDQKLFLSKVISLNENIFLKEISDIFIQSVITKYLRSYDYDSNLDFLITRITYPKIIEFYNTLYRKIKIKNILDV